MTIPEITKEQQQHAEQLAAMADQMNSLARDLAQLREQLGLQREEVNSAVQVVGAMTRPKGW